MATPYNEFAPPKNSTSRVTKNGDKTIEDLKKENARLRELYRYAEFMRRRWERDAGVLTRILNNPDDREFLLRQAAYVANTPERRAELLAEAESLVEEVEYCLTCGAGEADRMSVKCEKCGEIYFTRLACNHCRDPADIQCCYGCRRVAQNLT